MINEHIKKQFEDKFGRKPSITEIDSLDLESIKTLTSKSYIMWYHKKYFGEISLMLETIYEYDPTGILIYTKLINQNEDEKKLYNVFILSLNDKKNIVDYVINTLIKKK
jgi:hypothetical protein